MIKKILYSFLYGFKGLRHAYRYDQSIRLEFLGGIALIAIAYVFWPLKVYEVLFLILSFALILIAELINTAFEQILERLHPEHHELIGAGKDIAAAAVLIAVLFAFIIVLFIIASHTGLL